MSVPTFDNLFNPVLRALNDLGGSASNDELEVTVGDLLNLSEEDRALLRTGSATQTHLRYRIAWALTYLSKFGVVENSSRGIWALTPKGEKAEKVDETEVKRFVRSQFARKRPDASVVDVVDEPDEEEDAAAPSWEDELLDVLKNIRADAFERLCLRLLRENGFVQLEVTGKSGDNGIDGKGIVKLGNILSFRVVFQAKRWKDTVGSSVIRDFRGAMQGRADRGVVITTGQFTRDAKQEAQRDGAPPIDLIDGTELVRQLKDLRIGVKVTTRTVEDVSIERDWFQAL